MKTDLGLRPHLRLSSSRGRGDSSTTNRAGAAVALAERKSSVPVPDDAPAPPPVTEDAGWLVSLAFWLCLFAAGALYAALALGPRWLTTLELEREHLSNQLRLVALEQQVDHLRRVAAALEGDPAFAAELARNDFGARPSAEETIAVETALRLRAGSPPRFKPASLPEPWYVPLLAALAQPGPPRTLALAAAAALVLVSFGWLHDAWRTEALATLRRVRRGFGALVSRYRPSDRP
ncbi:MAG: septum formation initiator family protein [Planctomycetes bacterium]|nr:septum formation initiator family protein [Planctomycetota bacterium]